MERRYFVYIITNKYNSVLYTGVTNNLIRRIYEHREKLIKGFSKKYNCCKLVWYELFDDPSNASGRNKLRLVQEKINCYLLIK